MTPYSSSHSSAIDRCRLPSEREVPPDWLAIEQDALATKVHSDN